MKKILGIFCLLLAVCIVTSILNRNFLSPYNLLNTTRWTSLFAILGIGAAFVIITGGIDLSIGSVVGLIGCILPFLLERGWSAPFAFGALLVLSIGIGLIHGLLITKLRLQPFIVTLCGLLIYRGAARWFTGDATMGLEKYESLTAFTSGKLAIGSYYLPYVFFVMLFVGMAAAVVLNKTVYGRYMKAVGCNEDAARYNGIDTDRMKMVAYVICSLMAGVGGVLLALDSSSIQPSNFGNFYELYAIAAAVLGGCSLRGGEGSIAGVVIGTALIRVLRNAINVLRVPTTLEFAIIGLVILAGVVTDELVKRYAARRRLRNQTRQMERESAKEHDGDS